MKNSCNNLKLLFLNRNIVGRNLIRGSPKSIKELLRLIIRLVLIVNKYKL